MTLQRGIKFCGWREGDPLGGGVLEDEMHPPVDIQLTLSLSLSVTLFSIPVIFREILRDF